jgi:hypothetical protein
MAKKKKKYFHTQVKLKLAPYLFFLYQNKTVSEINKIYVWVSEIKDNLKV